MGWRLWLRGKATMHELRTSISLNDADLMCLLLDAEDEATYLAHLAAKKKGGR